MRRVLGLITTIIILMTIVGCSKSNTDKSKSNVTTESTMATSTDADIFESNTSETTIEELQMDSEGFYLAEDYAMMNEEVVNVRVSASESASIYMMAELGTVYPRTGYNDVWTRIVIENTSFYVLTSQVVVTEVPQTEDEAISDIASNSDADSSMIVVIDPGAQSTANVTEEQIGPGSEEMKPAAGTGCTGITTGVKEYDLNYTYADALKQELESRGYTVFITRENADVDMSNSARAEFSDASNADVLVRITMLFSSNTDLSGMVAFTQTETSVFHSNLYDESYKLATRVLQGLSDETDATNGGIYKTDAITLVNWSDAPTVVIGLGYLSNADDEQKLQEEEYLSKAVKGIADGIDYYFTE